jgi:quercetin dioxygenase-like cupin family protein
MKPSERQPDTTDLRMADGVFCKTMRIHKAGDLVPQHSHAFAHVSVIVRGRVKVWKDGHQLGDFFAPWGIMIEARTKHLFQALEDDTIILCVHDIGQAENVEIVEEHQIVG